MRPLSRGVQIFAVVGAVVSIISCVFPEFLSIFVLPIYLSVGWVAYVIRVAPVLQVNWGMVISTLIYGLLLLIGTHLFIRWIYREMQQPANDGQPRWRFAWTASGLCLLIAMFVAGIAMIGVVHQIVWMARAPVPMWHQRNGRESANRVKCASNLRQIGQGLLLYANDNNGKLPDDLPALLLAEDLTPDVFVCPSCNDTRALGETKARQAVDLLTPHHCSYIYLGKGLTQPVDSSRVLVVEHPANHAFKGMNVLYGDGHVEWLGSEAAKSLLRELHLLDEGESSTTQAATQP